MRSPTAWASSSESHRLTTETFSPFMLVSRLSNAIGVVGSAGSPARERADAFVTLLANSSPETAPPAPALSTTSDAMASSRWPAGTGRDVVARAPSVPERSK